MNMTWLLSAVILLVSVVSGAADADTPQFEPGVRIMAGASYLKADTFSAPTVVDWNNDGAKDLLSGQTGGAYIRLYLNQGTDLNPVFSTWSLITCNGVPIAVSTD
jgi:hypothetical protein